MLNHICYTTCALQQCYTTCALQQGSTIPNRPNVCNRFWVISCNMHSRPICNGIWHPVGFRKPCRSSIYSVVFSENNFCMFYTGCIHCMKNTIIAVNTLATFRDCQHRLNRIFYHVYKIIYAQITETFFL